MSSCAFWSATSFRIEFLRFSTRAAVSAGELGVPVGVRLAPKKEVIVEAEAGDELRWPSENKP